MSDSMPEVARATVTIIPNMQGSQAKIASDLGAVTESAGADAGKKAGSSFATSMGSAMSAGVGAVATGAAALGAAAVGAGKAIWDGANKVAELGDNIDKTSQKIGISAQAYQEWGYVFERSGANVDNLQTGMKKLSGVIVDAASGSESAVDKLAAVGLTIDDLNGKSQDEQLSIVIGKLQEMGSGADRTAAATDLLGKSATDMAAVLNMSAADTQALIDEAHEYGMVMSDETVGASAAFEDSLTKLQGTVQGVKTSMLGDLLPSLVTVTDGFSDLIAGNEGGAEAIAAGITEVISNISSSIPNVVTAVTEVITAVSGQLPSLLSGLATALIDALPTVIDGIVAIVPDLVTALTELIVILSGKLPEIIVPLVQAIPQLIPPIIEGLLVALPAIIQGLIQLMIAITQAMPEIQQTMIDYLPEMVSMIVEALVANAPLLVAGFIQLFAGVVVQMPAIIAGLLTAVPQIVQGIVDGLTAAWPQVVTTFQTLFNEVLPGIAEWGSKMVETARTHISNMVAAVQNIIGQLAPKVKAVLQKVISTVTSWGSQMAAKGKAAAETLVKAVVAKAKELPTQMISIGKNLVEGLWNGIKSMTDWLKDKIAQFCNGALDSIKSFFGVESPSKVMRDEVGKMLVEGMALGITKNQKIITKAMEQAGALMSTAFDANIMLAGDNPSAGLQNNTFNNTITVNGAENPEAWAGEFVRALNRQANMAMG